MGINENIFAILKDKGITQKEFSKLTGISESTISDWKKKGKTPRIENLKTISKALGVDLEVLLRDGEEATNVDIPAPLLDMALTDDEKIILEKYRKADSQQKKVVIAYLEKLFEVKKEKEPLQKEDVFAGDTILLQQKNLARRLRKLARLDRIKLDESEHTSKLNLHLLKYLDYVGLDKLEYIKQYLSNIQPFMIAEIKTQEKFDNAICVLDEYYRISVYIKVDATKGEEIIVSFHENNNSGIARRNYFNENISFVYVFADSIGSYIPGSESYSINFFITRGVSTFPINVPAQKYDDEGFIVRYTYINNAVIDIANRYLEDLYSSDVDFSKITLFTSLQQLSFTSYGNDIFSNISIMIDSLIIQENALGKQIADSALCIYCSTVELLPKDKEELLKTLKERYKVNSIRALPQILERVEMNLS